MYQKIFSHHGFHKNVKKLNFQKELTASKLPDGASGGRNPEVADE